MNIRQSTRKGSVYRFTNENVTSYGTLYSLDNANVLSVLGSGDQYFTCILNGASEVDLYDINVQSWPYFVFKYYAIMILSFEEFFSLFVESYLNNEGLCDKVMNYLPMDVKKSLNDFIHFNGKLSEMLLNDAMHDNRNFLNGRVIPYFDRDNYYKLQSLLCKRNLPEVYFYDLRDLPIVLESKSYDIVFNSNIYSWLSMPSEEYKNLLLMFNSSTFQALYNWKPTDYLKESFLNSGFTIDLVDSVSMLKKGEKDYVFTLGR